MPVGRSTRLRVLRDSLEVRGGLGLVRLVRIVSRMTHALADLVRPHGLSVAEFEVLLCLKGGEGISQQDLADQMLVTKGNVCVLMQKMATAGLIERRADPTDQRYHRLYLTDAGRRLLAEVMPEHRRMLNRMISGMDVGEQATFFGLLSRVEQALDDAEL